MQLVGIDWSKAQRGRRYHVGGDAGQLCLGELAQGQRTQCFLTRMVQRRLG
jgi:hypothetical protein